MIGFQESVVVTGAWTARPRAGSKGSAWHWRPSRYNRWSTPRPRPGGPEGKRPAHEHRHESDPLPPGLPLHLCPPWGILAPPSWSTVPTLVRRATPGTPQAVGGIASIFCSFSPPAARREAVTAIRARARGEPPFVLPRDDPAGRHLTVVYGLRWPGCRPSSGPLTAGASPCTSSNSLLPQRSVVPHLAELVRRLVSAVPLRGLVRAGLPAVEPDRPAAFVFSSHRGAHRRIVVGPATMHGPALVISSPPSPPPG